MQSVSTAGFIVCFFALAAKIFSTFAGNKALAATGQTPVKKQAPVALQTLALFFLMIAFIFSNPRGQISFQANFLIIFGLSCFAIVWAFFLEQSLAHRNPAAASILVLLALSVSAGAWSQTSRTISTLTGLTLKDYSARVSFLKQVPGSIFDRLGKDDRILTFVYCPDIYITAGRLPISGYYYYLPWEAKYNERPVGGYKIDFPADFETKAPKMIYFDNWKVWNKYSIEEYAPAIADQLSKTTASWVPNQVSISARTFSKN